MRVDGWVAFVIADTGGTGQFVARVHLPTLKGKLFLRIPLFFGPALTWSSTGSLFLSIDFSPTDSLFVGWPFGAKASVLDDGPTTGFILPGN